MCVRVRARMCACVHVSLVPSPSRAWVRTYEASVHVCVHVCVRVCVLGREKQSYLIFRLRWSVLILRMMHKKMTQMNKTNRFAYVLNNVLLVVTIVIVTYNHRQYYVARLRSLDVHIHTIGNGYNTLHSIP